MKIPASFLVALALVSGLRAGTPTALIPAFSGKTVVAPGVFSARSVAFAAPAEIAALVRETLAAEWPGVAVAPADDPARASLVFRLSPASGATPGAYALEITGAGATVTAADADGLRNGFSTLRMLADIRDGVVTLPEIAVNDAPRFRYRGLMLDSSRHMQSVAGIRRLLDLMSLLKLNVFHWHLTDNNGWRAEVPSYPELTRIGGFLCRTPESERNGFYTTAQMREIGDYARARGIEVIPEIDVPGHTSALIEAYPEFRCPTDTRALPSTWKTNRSPNLVVCVGNPKLVPFLTTVCREVAGAIGAKRVHIGGDEVEEGIWSKCPLCLAAMKKAGVKAERHMEREFLSELAVALRKEGLETVNWLERPGEGIPKVDTTIAWRGTHRDPGQVAAAAAAGVPVVNAVGDYAYLDYNPYPGTPKSSWLPTIPLKRVYDYPVSPAGLKNPDLLRGGECTLWTEEVMERDIDAMLFPRVLAFAEQMWTPDARRDWKSFESRLAAVRPRFEARGVRFAGPPDRTKVLAATPGVRVVASLPHWRNCWPEYAFDGVETTSYVSAANAKSGDTLAVFFPAATTIRKVTLLTGNYYLHDVSGGAVKSGVLERTSDGETWTVLAPLVVGYATSDVPPGTTGLRLRLTADQGGRLVVSEFRAE